MTDNISPTLRVIATLGEMNQIARSVVYSWYGVDRPLADVLAQVQFDENAKSIAASGSLFPARPDDAAWVAGETAYEALKDSPAAFIVQLAGARADGDSWRAQSMLANPTSTNQLWRSLAWAGGAREAVAA